jgi:hypothetical protein
MSNQLSELLKPKLLIDFEQNKLSESLTDAIEYLTNFPGQAFNLKLLQEITLVFENCDQMVLKADKISYFGLKDFSIKPALNDFFVVTFICFSQQ